MAKKFNSLRANMPRESRDRAHACAREMLAEMSLQDMEGMDGFVGHHCPIPRRDVKVRQFGDIAPAQ